MGNDYFNFGLDSMLTPYNYMSGFNQNSFMMDDDSSFYNQNLFTSSPYAGNYQNTSCRDSNSNNGNVLVIDVNAFRKYHKEKQELDKKTNTALTDSETQLKKMEEQRQILNDSTSSAEAKKKAAELIANDFKVDEKTEKKERVKIGFGESVKNIGKGIGKFFKSMVTDENGKFSPKKALTTGLVVGATVAACAALEVVTCGAATPFIAWGLGSLGAIMGGVEIAKGASKVSHAQTKEEAEAGWQDIGSGGTGAVLSAVGIRAGAAASKAANISKGVKLATDLAPEATRLGTAGDEAISLIKTGKRANMKAGLKDLETLSNNKAGFESFNSKVSGGLKNNLGKTVKVNVSAEAETKLTDFANTTKNGLKQEITKLENENKGYLKTNNKVKNSKKKDYKKNEAEIKELNQKISELDSLLGNIKNATNKDEAIAAINKAKDAVSKANKNGTHNDLVLALNNMEKEVNSVGFLKSTFTKQNLKNTGKSLITKDFNTQAGRILPIVSVAGTTNYEANSINKFVNDAVAKDALSKLDIAEKNEYIKQLNALIEKAAALNIELNLDEKAAKEIEAMDVAKLKAKVAEIRDKVEKG